MLLSRRALVLVLVLPLVACGEGEGTPRAARTEDTPARSETSASPRVPRRQQEEGLARCGETLMRMEGPESAPTFARLVRECSGMFARRRCRDALAAEPFSRDGIAEACRDDYCESLRPAPSFCRVEMPTDAEFLEQFAGFSRSVLRRDLRRVVDREGADEIADLFADLVESQAARQ